MKCTLGKEQILATHGVVHWFLKNNKYTGIEDLIKKLASKTDNIDQYALILPQIIVEVSGKIGRDAGRQIKNYDFLWDLDERFQKEGTIPYLQEIGVYKKETKQPDIHPTKNLRRKKPKLTTRKVAKKAETETVNENLNKIPGAYTVEEKLKLLPERAKKVLENLLSYAEDIVLSEDNNYYVSKLTNAIYERVSRYTSDFADLEVEDGIIVSNGANIENAQQIGTNVDDVSRDFFSGELKKYEDYVNKDGSSFFGSKDVFEAFVEDLKQLKQRFNERGEVVFTSEVRLFSDKIGIAGTTDIITVDLEGRFRIYDIKSKKSLQKNGSKVSQINSFEKYGFYENDVANYNRQLNFYASLFEELTGEKIHELYLVPIKVAYSNDKNDFTTTEAKITDFIKLENKSNGKTLMIDNQRDINPDTKIPDTLPNGEISVTRNSTVLNKAKELNSLEKVKKDSDAYRWLVKTFGNTFVEEHWKFLWNTTNSTLWGQFNNGVTTIYGDANSGTIYHEAWHNFSQMFLSTREINKLYSELQKLNPSLSIREIEEILADDFADYMQDTSLKKERPIRNTVFRKIVNFFKGLFGVKPSVDYVKTKLDNIFYNLYAGEFNQSTYRTKEFPINLLFSSKSSEISPEYIEQLKDFKKLNLVSGNPTKGVKAVFDHISSEILDIIHERSLSIEEFIDNLSSVDNNLIWFKEIEGIISDKYEKHSVKTNEDGTANEEYDENLDQYWSYLNDNHDFRKNIIFEYFNEYFFTDIELSADQLENENDGDDRSREDKEHDNKGWSESIGDPRKLLNKYLKFIYNNVSKLNKEGDKFKVVVDKFHVAEKSSSVSTYDVLLNLVADTTSYDKKYMKILETSRLRPELLTLLRFFPSPSRANLEQVYENYIDEFYYLFENIIDEIESEEIVLDDVLDAIKEKHSGITFLNFRNMLNNSLNKTNEKLKTALIEVTQSGDTFTSSSKILSGSSRNEYKIKNHLREKFRNKTPDQFTRVGDKIESEFDGEIESLDILVLNLANLFGPNRKIDIETLLEKETKEIFNILGLILSDNTIKELNSENLKQIVNYLFDYGIEYYNKAAPLYKLGYIKSDDILGNITSPLEFFQNGHRGLNQTIREYNKTVTNRSEKLEYFDSKKTVGTEVKKILIYEELSNLDFAANTKLNAENKAQTEFPFNHTISNIVALLNDYEQFPTYQDLIKHPIFKHWDINKNPLMNTLMLNGLFQLNPDFDNYGSRNKRKDLQYERISVDNFTGVNFNNFTDEKGSVSGALEINDSKSSSLNHIDGFVFLSVLPTYFGNGHYLTLPGERSGQRLLTPPSNLSNGTIDFGKKIKVFNNKNDDLTAIDSLNDSDNYENSTILKIFTHYLKNEFESIKLGVSSKYNYMYLLLDTPSGRALKEALSEAKTFDEVFDTTDLSNDSNMGLFANAIIEYVNSTYNSIKEELSENGVYDIKSVLGVNESTENILKSNILNFYMYKIEESILFYGDFSILSDPFKRLKMFTSGGNNPANDKTINDEFNTNDPYHRALYKRRILNQSKHKGFTNTSMTDEVQNEDGIIRTETIQKVPGKIDETLISYIRTDLQSSQAADSFAEGIEDAADASAITTLDFYRIRAIRLGQWLQKHEDAYRKYVNQGYLSSNDAGLFFTLKDLYTGWTNVSNKPVMHKMAVSPIILTKEQYEKKEDSKLYNIETHILRNKKDYIIVESGSKGQKPNEMLSLDDVSNSENTSSANGQELFYEFYKEQIESAKKQKKKKSFGSQFRKLFFSDMFNDGIPVSYSGKKEWSSLTENEKLKNEIYSFYNTYKKILNDFVTGDAFTKIENNAGIKIVNDELIINEPNKLRSFIVNNLESSGLDRSSVDFLVLNDDNTFTSTIEESQYKYTIQQALINILVSNITNMKVNGEPLTQTPSVIKNPDNALSFYKINDETGEMIPMEVITSFSDNYKHLLKLKYNGKRIRNVDTLNKAMLDPKFKDSIQEYLKVIMYRIPTQDMPSIDIATIKQFTISSSEMQVPGEYLKKTGSDFDNDKIYTFRPQIISEKIQSLNVDDYVGKINEELNNYNLDVKVIKSNDKGNGINIKSLVEKIEKNENLDLKEQMVKSAYDKVLESQLKDSVDFRLSTKGLTSELIELGHQMLQLKDFQKNLLSTIDTSISNDIAIEILSMKYKLNNKDEKVKLLLLDLADDKTLDKLGINKEEQNKLKEFGNFFNPVRHIAAHKNYLGGSRGLGIFAKLRSTVELYKSFPSTLNSDFDYKGTIFPVISKLAGNTIDNRIAIGKNLNKSKNKVSVFFSEGINIFVDRGNNPSLISALNLSPSVVPVATHLGKIGVSDKALYYFVNSPLIMKYVTKMDAFNSKVFLFNNFNKIKANKNNTDKSSFLSKDVYKAQIISDLLSQYNSEFSNVELEGDSVKDAYSYFNRLSEILNEYQSSSFNISALAESISKGTMIPEHLVQFLMYEIQSDKMREEESELSFDTDNVQSISEAERREENVANFLDPDTKTILSKDTINHIYNDSVISPLKINKFIANSFGELFSVFRSNLFVSQKKEILSSSNLKQKNNQEQLNRVERSFENDFIIFMLQANPNTKENVLNAMESFNVLNKQNIQNKVAFATSKLLKYFEQDYTLLNSEFPLLANIKVTHKSGTNVLMVDWEGASLSGDIIAEVKEHWESVLNGNHYILENNPRLKKIVTEIYSDLVASAMLQYGLNKTPSSYTIAVPDNQYNKRVRSALNHFKNSLKFLRSDGSYDFDLYGKTVLNYSDRELNDKYTYLNVQKEFKNSSYYGILKAFENYNKSFQSNNPQYFYQTNTTSNEGYLKNYMIQFDTNGDNDWALYIPDIYNRMDDYQNATIKQREFLSLDPLYILASSEGTVSDSIDTPADQSAVINVAKGINIVKKALSQTEERVLFDMIKPYLEQQAVRSNKGVNAPLMIGLGLRWDYTSNNQGRTPVEIGPTIDNSVSQRNKYRYYSESSDGQPLGEIPNKLKELLTKATGVDASNYDGAIINIYPQNGFISAHNDVDESATAINYPVLVVNIGGNGSLSIEGAESQANNNSYNNKVYSDVQLNSGDAYIFGINGENRKVFHRTLPSSGRGTLPKLNIKGQNIPANSYRITITLRRVRPLTADMPKTPVMQSVTNQPGQQNSIEVKTKSKVPQAEKVKAPFKSKNSIGFIGFGKEGSSTKDYAEQYKEKGLPVNPETYVVGGVYFASQNGDGYNREETLNEIIKALDSGAKVLLDSKLYIDSSTYNKKGEGWLYSELEKQGYNQQKTSNENTVLWSKSINQNKINKEPVQLDMFNLPSNDPNIEDTQPNC